MKRILALFILILGAQAWGYNINHTPEVPSNTTPIELQGVGVSEHRGQSLNPNLKFQNEMGQTVLLGSYLNHGRPLLMAMVYYDCPNLCNMQLNGYVDVMKKMKLKMGVDYDLVAVSMDSKETPMLAAKKKSNYIKALGLVDAADVARVEDSWHFLVGQEPAVKEFAKDIGFSYKWDEQQKQFSHAAATYIVTANGEISRYIYGIEFQPETLRLALIEAAKGKIGTIVDQIVLFCFQFNPNKNKYVLYSYNLMRVAGLLTIILLAIGLIPVWVREKRRRLVG